MITNDILIKLLRGEVASGIVRLSKTANEAITERLPRMVAEDLRGAADRASTTDQQSGRRISGVDGGGRQHDSHPDGAGRRESRVIDERSTKGETIAGQLPRRVPGELGRRNRAIDTVIDERSTELGLHTPAQRALEAGLLIDEPFLHLALAGRQKHPELLFGKREWAGYLDARAFARRHGDRELTVPFMVELHQRLSHFTAPDHGGIFARGRRWGAHLHPFTDKEMAAVRANPYLELLPPDTAPLRYGGIGYRISSPEAIQNELQSLSTWYNDARNQPDADPYRLAAELQQRFVSIHPWDDYNGRSSRLLMNWSLERDGLPPSAVADFSKDLFSMPEEWVDDVRAGSRVFGERADRLERLGDTADPISVFDLEREHEHYLDRYGQRELFTPGDTHDANFYRSLLEELRDNRQGVVV